MAVDDAGIVSASDLIKLGFDLEFNVVEEPCTRCSYTTGGIVSSAE